MNNAPSLVWKAGHAALARIRQHGLAAADIHLLPGAAGGPKGIGLLGLDCAIFGEFLPRARQRRTLIGASVGSWRFAAVASGRTPTESVAALERLADLYTRQRFPEGSSARDISRRCVTMLDDLLQDTDATVLGNPDYRLAVATVRSRGLLSSDQPALLGAGLLGVALTNLVSRRLLALSMERMLSAPDTEPLPLADDGLFTTHQLPLTAANLRATLMASGSIPLVLEGVTGIAGAPAGIYRDGGLLDYHLDLAWQTEGVVLYPHFTDHVTPGWFDKPLKWRRGHPERLKNVLLVAPSPAYLARLPHGKLPDRTDFKRYLNDDAGREKYWRQALAESRRMGDEFLETLASGRLAEQLQPL